MSRGVNDLAGRPFPRRALLQPLLFVCASLHLLLASAHADQLAESRQAFWGRVNCVEIFAYAEVEDASLSRTIERTVVDRLLTVWRREMPDHALSAGYTSHALMQWRPDQSSPLGCGPAPPAKWNPRLNIFLKAARVSDRSWFGTVRTTFEISFPHGNACSAATELCLVGPTYPSLGGSKPIFPSFSAEALPIRGGGGSDPIFANQPDTRLAPIAVEAGEELIKSIAHTYYDAKAKLPKR
jgi:hypothetical protein